MGLCLKIAYLSKGVKYLHAKKIIVSVGTISTVFRHPLGRLYSSTRNIHKVDIWGCCLNPTHTTRDNKNTSGSQEGFETTLEVEIYCGNEKIQDLI